MHRTNFVIISVSVGVFSLLSIGFTPFAKAVGEMPSKGVCAQQNNSATVTGGCVATDKRKGNCMACHKFNGLKQARLQPGTIAPPLIAMKARFPDKKKLRMLMRPSLIHARICRRSADIRYSARKKSISSLNGSILCNHCKQPR